MSRYAWAITKDHIADENAREGSNLNAKGVIGPRGVKLTAEQIENHPNREYFKMYDDDGELYYEGYFVGADDAEGFEPLEDFGMPNAGCTGIKYRNPKTGKMEWL